MSSTLEKTEPAPLTTISVYFTSLSLPRKKL
jgi:hypothetical protein